MWIACIDEPQKRLTVVPATDSGRSARKPIRRATLNPCSPSGKAQPRIRSSMSSAVTPVRSTRARDHLRRQIVGPDLGERALVGEVNGERA